MKHLLGAVLENYSTTRARLNGRAVIADTPDQQALLADIPGRIRAHLASRSAADLYKVVGSIGNGNIARVPWVGIFKNSVTQSAQNGFYVVLLFAEDMSSCVLSLNQGVTAVERLYTTKFAWKKMAEASAAAARKLNVDPEAIVGRISLKSTGDLGRGYEFAAIKSFEYRRGELPDDANFFRDLDRLLENYDDLIQRFDTDLFSLFNVTEDEFQQIALEKAATQGISDVIEVVGGVEISANARLGSKGYVRSPTVAAGAIRAANFECEINSDHWTFISRARQKRYVEAHHLIPISQQAKFHYSLDVMANVISLCATCHRMLHYGLRREKRALLRVLLQKRRVLLQAKSIPVDEAEFYNFYGNEAVIEE